MASVRLDGVVRRFGKTVAVDHIDLVVGEHEFVVLLGPSGCGKTTTLRCIAGLEQVDEGRIFFGSSDVTALPSGKRGIGMVFQSYALFPHMRVRQNIGFGLRLQKCAADEVERRVSQVAEMMQLESLLDRYPSQLSGGQRQRVAVARAVVIQPHVLLMDEPLSNLDALLRIQMRTELKRLHGEIRATTVYVTHDQVEALSLGDRIAVLQNGRIVQCDGPHAVYDRPANTFVGGFIGNPPMNFIAGELYESEDGLRVQCPGMMIHPDAAACEALRRAGDTRVTVGIRPENIEIGVEASAHRTPAGQATARVVVSELLGAQQLLSVELNGAALHVSADPDLRVLPGETLPIWFEQAKVRFFDPAGLAI